MARIEELNDAALRVVYDDNGDIDSIIDAKGRGLNIPLMKTDPVTKVVDFAGGNHTISTPLVSLWVNRPSAALTSGKRLFVTDVGISGSFWFSNGTYWLPEAPITLATVNANSAGFGRKSDADTVRGDLFNMVIPGGLLGINSCLEITPHVSFPSSATQKTVEVRFGSSTPFSKNRTTTTLESPLVHIVNRGSASSQIFPYNGSSTYGSGLSGSIATGSVDTSIDQLLAVSGTWGTAGAGANDIKLESLRIRLIP